jgi:DNA-binding XRE family transcriptional regulator
MDRCVYVAGSDEGPKKIGIADDVAKRLCSLQGASPYPLKVIYAQKFSAWAAGMVERKAHQALADRRMRGEWFDVSGDEAIGAVQRAASEAPTQPEGSEKLISPVQCKGARSMLGLSQENLAVAVGVSDRTIHGFERRRGEINRPTRIAIRKVLEARGARFVESGDQVGVLVVEK